MKHSIKQSVSAIAGAAVLCVLLSSCAKKATDEQLSQYHDLKREIASLENSIKQNDSEKARLNTELTALQAQVGKCNDDVAFVKSKLAMWPDCWPDWHPAPPPPPATTPEPKH